MIPILLAAAALCSAAPLMSAPAAKAVLPQGEDVLSGDAALEALKIGGSSEDNGEAEIVALAGEPYAKALRMTTLKPCSKIWDVQVNHKLPRGFASGDVMLITFAVRSVTGGKETAEGRTQFVFEKASDPWTKSSETDVMAPRTWKTYSIPFKVVGTYAPEESHINFRMGYAPQVIELADVKLTWFGQGVDLTALPRTRLTYKGREAGAPWRKAALARIQKVRKADLTVEVRDAAGKPLAGASVAVSMTRSAYRWGTAVQAKRLYGFDMDPKRYKEEIPKHFNAVVFENDLKWPFWEEGLKPANGWDKRWVDDAMKWAEEKGLTVKGHCLVWPGYRNLPARLREYGKDCAKVREACLTHIAGILPLYGSRIHEWDVMNESVHETDLQNACGRDIMVEWFKKAREVEPKTRLYINEYAIFSGGGADIGAQDAYEKEIAWLLEQGAPIDGIGIQSHLGQSLTDPERILELLDRFGRFGREISVTEFDLDTQGDEELGYEYMRDYLIALYSHASTAGMYMWGFWDGAQWMKMGPLFTTDWKLKGSGRAWKEMVEKEWRTVAAGMTAGTGRYSTRAFHGDYTVTASFAGKKQTVRTTLTLEGKSVLITLK
jgi:GH35 family endo-1,4-beta-xylanase